MSFEVQINPNQFSSYIVEKQSKLFKAGKEQKEWLKRSVGNINWLVKQYRKASLEQENFNHFFDSLIKEAGVRRQSIATAAKTEEATDFGVLRANLAAGITRRTRCFEHPYLEVAQKLTENLSRVFYSNVNPPYILPPYQTLDFEKAVSYIKPTQTTDGRASYEEYRTIELPIQNMQKDPICTAVGTVEKCEEISRYINSLPFLQKKLPDFPQHLHPGFVNSFMEALEDPKIALEVQAKYPQEYRHLALLSICWAEIAETKSWMNLEKVMVQHVTFRVETKPGSNVFKDINSAFTFLGNWKNKSPIKSPAYIVYQDIHQIPDTLEACKSILRKIITTPTNQIEQKQFLAELAMFEYFFANALPYERGTAAIGEWFTISLAALHGFELHYTPQKSVNLCALTSTYSDFMSEVDSMMTLKPNGSFPKHCPSAPPLKAADQPSADLVEDDSPATAAAGRNSRT